MIARLLCALEGNAGDVMRLSYAEQFAGRLGGKVSAIVPRQLPDLLAITDPSGSAFLRELIARAEADVTAALSQLAPLINPAVTQLDRLDAVPGRETEALIDRSRLVDLIIGTLPASGDLSPSLAEALLFHSGRPCLFVPKDWTQGCSLDQVVIGWKNSREAALAVGAALPILKRAGTVHIIAIEENGETVADTAIDGLRRHLEDHGVASGAMIVRGTQPAGLALRTAADERKASLIVMGGYGHSRMREIVMGGVTRDLMSHGSRPVLMAH